MADEPGALDADLADRPAVACHGLVKIYPSLTGPVHAVRGVDFSIERGSTVAVMGPSGSGKSSLLRMVAGLTEPSAGTIEIAGQNLFALGRRRRHRQRTRLLTHVEQRPSDNLLPHLTARQQLRRAAKGRGADPDDALAILDAVGLGHRADHQPAELSGGEQQRLAFALATAGTPALLVADEPTAELDSASTEALIDSLEPLQERGVSILLASHDPRLLDRVDEVVELRDGTIAMITRDGRALSTIDGSGRIQLPPAIRGRFRTDRVELVWNEERGRLEVTEP